MTQIAFSRPIPAQRLLLGCGVVAGPSYVIVAMAQALTREGFDLARHPWSYLANGDLGWIQTANFVLTGLATIAAAVGLRHALAQRAPCSSARSPASRPAAAPPGRT